MPDEARYGDDYLPEFHRILAQRYTRSGRVLEWGSGLTTLALLAHLDSIGSELFLTVDHSLGYQAKVLEGQPDRPWFRAVTLDQRGPCRGQEDSESAYSTYPLSLDVDFDLIFIDGRRRVECAFTAALMCHADTTVIIHDYRRGRYQPVLGLFDVVEDGPQFRVMRVRPEILGALASRRSEVSASMTSDPAMVVVSPRERRDATATVDVDVAGDLLASPQPSDAKEAPLDVAATVNRALEVTAELLKEKRADEAWDIAAPALALAPNHVGLLWRASGIAMRRGDSETAVELSLRARELAPERSDIGINLAWHLMQAGQLSLVPEHFTEGELADLVSREENRAYKARGLGVLRRLEFMTEAAPPIMTYETELPNPPGLAPFAGLVNFSIATARPHPDIERLAPASHQVLAGFHPDGQAALLIDVADKSVAREAPFVRALIRKDARVVTDVPLSRLDVADWPLQRQRFVFSPGRVGSTALVRMLRDQGLEAISEIDAHEQLARMAISGHVSIETSRILSSAATRSILDAPVPCVINKTHDRAAMFPMAVMNDGDDAVFLWRTLPGWLSSWWRVGTRTIHELVTGLEIIVRGQQLAMEAGRLHRVLWYDDIEAGRLDEINEAFDDLLPAIACELVEGDSQADTGLSREALSRRRVSEPPIAEFERAWSASSGAAMARELGLDPLAPQASRGQRMAVYSRPSPGRIMAVSDEHPRIPVLPTSMAFGGFDHYFHFLMGYLLPVAERLSSLRPRRLAVRDCGPMNRHFDGIPGWDFAVVSPEDWVEKVDVARAVGVIGMDHPLVYDVSRLRAAALALFPGLDFMPVASVPGQPEILVVDRTLPDAYYLDGRASKPGGGATRRSVPNMRDIAETLRSQGASRCVTLEEMPLGEQVDAFQSANVVVAQHGAALANLVWCRPGTKVVEIQMPAHRLPFFSELAAELSLPYAMVEQETDHSEVDPARVLAALASLS